MAADGTKFNQAMFDAVNTWVELEATIKTTTSLLQRTATKLGTLLH
jgi:hypothetical protein